MSERTPDGDANVERTTPDADAAPGLTPPEPPAASSVIGAALGEAARKAGFDPNADATTGHVVWHAMGGVRGILEAILPGLVFIVAFTLTTDATILSNNTDDGPQADPAGKKMQWTVGGGETRAAPMALVQLQR